MSLIDAVCRPLPHCRQPLLVHMPRHAPFLSPRYCGEGCSHADWRGPTGHRKTCKALGAAKAARRQAAAEAAAIEAAAAGATTAIQSTVSL